MSILIELLLGLLWFYSLYGHNARQALAEKAYSAALIASESLDLREQGAAKFQLARYTVFSAQATAWNSRATVYFVSAVIFAVITGGSWENPVHILRRLVE